MEAAMVVVTAAAMVAADIMAVVFTAADIAVVVFMAAGIFTAERRISVHSPPRA
jgi:hypothetical protein